jgi:hypothetical protein
MRPPCGRCELYTRFYETRLARVVGPSPTRFAQRSGYRRLFVAEKIVFLSENNFELACAIFEAGSQ